LTDAEIVPLFIVRLIASTESCRPALLSALVATVLLVSLTESAGGGESLNGHRTGRAGGRPGAAAEMPPAIGQIQGADVSP